MKMRHADMWIHKCAAHFGVRLTGIPVDSVTKRLTFTFSVDTKGNALKLTRPSGGAIAEGTASTEVTELNCGRIVTVSSPEAGDWRAEISGTGRCWLKAQAQSDIFLSAPNL
jgi:hypothetical protein